MAIGCRGIVDGEGVSPSRFLGGLWDRGLLLVFGFSSSYRRGFWPGRQLRERERETAPHILRVGYAGARACRQGKFGILLILNSSFGLTLDIPGVCLAKFTVRPRADAGEAEYREGSVAFRMLS